MTKGPIARRDFIRLGGGLTLAAASLPATGMSDQGESAPPTGHHVFDVRHFGATGDGKTVDTAAVNAAIQAAAAVGGGTVVFPPGEYVCFSIHLSSHVHLYLGEGAVLIAADSPQPGESTGYHGGTYDQAEPDPVGDHYEDFGHRHWRNALLWAVDQHDIMISGPGMIFGRGLANGEPQARGGYPWYNQEQAGVGDKSISMKDCHNVTLRDFSILKAGHFGMLLTGTDNVTIDNLKIDTDCDGMDIDCCRNVRITNCTVNSPWDDGICLKSSYALGYPRPTENVAINNCLVTGLFALGTVLNGKWQEVPESEAIPRQGRIKCGTESNGGFKNITITNCVFDSCKGYTLESVDGGSLEDIAISNSTMRNLDGGPFFFRLGARLRGPKATTHVGTFRRILISNVECYGAHPQHCSILSGIPGHFIEDVKFANLYIESQGGGRPRSSKPPENIAGYPSPLMFGVSPAYGFFIRHLKRLEMSHVELALGSPDGRPAFYFDDVDRVDLFGITAPKGTSDTFSLHDVSDFRLGWSRAAPDKTLTTTTNLDF